MEIMKKEVRSLMVDNIVQDIITLYGKPNDINEELMVTTIAVISYYFLEKELDARLDININLDVCGTIKTILPTIITGAHKLMIEKDIHEYLKTKSKEMNQMIMADHHRNFSVKNTSSSMVM